MKAVFMGTSSFAIPCLQALLDHKLEVLAVYTQPPRRAGRGKKIQLSPVGHFAQENNLALLYPKNFLDPYDIQVMKTLKPDVVLVVAYGLILLVGSRVLAGVLGGIYGDRIGYERGRRSTREHWKSYICKNPSSHSIDL